MQLRRKYPDHVRQHAILVLCVFAYLFLSLLVIEQGRTIDSQRALIRQLFSDTMELNSLKLERVEPRR